MSAMNDLFIYNFQDEMRTILDKCHANRDRPLNDLHSIFSDVDDGLFTYLVSNPFAGYEAVKQIIPGWAPDDIRQDSTGSFSFHEHVLDATWFWRTVRDRFTRLTGKPIKQARVVDYGGGWGRVARFANKDVPAEQFYVLEPNPIFRKIYEECQLPGHLVEIDWLSTNNNGIDNIDLIFSYSIITHSSDRLTRNIVDRWAEMTSKGSVVAFTVRPGCYLLETGGDMSVFTGYEDDDLIKNYQDGNLIYRSYQGIEDWGVTVAPEKYLNTIFSDRFCIVDRAFQPQTMNQMILFAERL